jgi:chloramphenicol 3-O phosphotransferase
VAGDIIFLTGASSAGKTSIAKGLQIALDRPFLHLQLDAFIDMLPPHDGPLFVKLIGAFHHAIAALAQADFNLIVDHVLVRQDWTQDCARLLADKYVLFVGVHCPLEELERREALRDAKRQGFARSQFDYIHAGKMYDVEVDTSRVSTDVAVEIILSAFALRKQGALRSLAV